MDFWKAFDSGKWEKLWQILSEMSLSKDLINVIQSFDTEGTAVVRIDKVEIYKGGRYSLGVDTLPSPIQYLFGLT